MIRKRVGVLVGAGVLGVVAVVACGDRILDDGIPKGIGGGGDSGSNGGSCWPTDPACYGGKTKDDPGGECMAQRDNTPTGAESATQRIQMRQNWLRAMQPAGNTVPVVYGNLNLFTTLPWPACNMGTGTSGYIQLLDFTLNSDGTGTSRNGFAKWFPADQLQNTITNGLCMVEEDWPNDTYILDATQMSPSTNYPPGLPPPMARAVKPWHVAPTIAKRLVQDFDLTVTGTREQLLASFLTGGANAGYTGVFYYDPVTGYSHGFSPLSFLVIYDQKTPTETQPGGYIAVPIREAEVKGTFNDPAHPNCMGAYRGDALDPETNCVPSTNPDDPTFPAWGCGSQHPCARGEGPATTDGYFLITELEQVYSKVLQSTLCVSYPTYPVSKAAGWADSQGRCRGVSQWNPSDPINGLPQGDWCAATNSPKTSDCHDAYKSKSFHVFSGFNIKDGVCTAFGP